MSKIYEQYFNLMKRITDDDVEFSEDEIDEILRDQGINPEDAEKYVLSEFNRALKSYHELQPNTETSTDPNS